MYCFLQLDLTVKKKFRSCLMPVMSFSPPDVSPLWVIWHSDERHLGSFFRPLDLGSHTRLARRRPCVAVPQDERTVSVHNNMDLSPEAVK